ncbi:MAG: hypothetical protein M0C28_15585 [Candidatus Moduliflexus flocculans]|nr:hypothetical protein [Candidatus Moduliflexus flocculans]
MGRQGHRQGLRQAREGRRQLLSSSPTTRARTWPRSSSIPSAPTRTTTSRS